MKLYRIARAEHIKDLSGDGARIYGGRWNEKGLPVIYTSESLALAALEYLVHLPLVLAPADLKYCAFSILDDVRKKVIRPSALPDDWNAMPFQGETVRLGSEWTRSRKSLLLRVPSVIVPGEHNVLVNPLNPDFRKVRAGRPRPFVFDERVLERGR